MTEDEIEQSKRRVEMGAGDDIDQHRLRAAERREQIVRKEMPLDGNLLVVRKIRFDANGNAEYGINPEVADALNAWFDTCFDERARETVIAPMGEALGEIRAELRKSWRQEIGDAVTKLHSEVEQLKRRIEEQNVVIAELRGELRGMRSLHANGSPKIWRP